MSRFLDSSLENRPGSRYGLALASAFVLTVAGAVWSIRAQKALLRAEQGQRTALIEQASVQARSTERRSTQHAVSLLIRAFLADRQSTYSALSHTRAMYAGKEMQSTARVTRKPTAMAITYLSGDRKGLSLGYNQRWMWRQPSGAPMEAYAEMAEEPASTLARRMTLMLENYSVARVGESKIEGRPVEVLEIRPLHAIDGAKGPGKSLSVDRETGLALETETFDHQWKSMMKSSLSQVDFTPRITPSTFASPHSMSQAAKRKTWMASEMGHAHEDVALKTGWQPPTPKYLPPGFAFDSVGVHHCGVPGAADGGESGPVAAMARYTDGLNMLSVFAMPEPSGAKSASPEAVCDFGPGTLISKAGAGGYIIAVADLPQATLRRVVDSTELQKADKGAAKAAAKASH